MKVFFLFKIYSKIASISDSVSHELSLPAELSEVSDELESSSFWLSLSLLFVSSVR